MDATRFEKSMSGRLLRVGHGEEAYWSFVPNPLPPDLPPDSELVRALFDAAYSLAELGTMGRMLPNPHLLIGPFLRREAVLSSRIEGTRASIADLYAYEAGQLPMPGMGPPVSEAEVREVLNYVAALEYGLQRLSTLPVSLRLMRELHQRLMEGVRGEHATPGESRRSPNWIGGRNPSDAAFVPPPVPEMEGALDAFEKYLHSEDPDNTPLVRLALIHYQFEAVHPFLDGNGRIGRLLISLLLVDWKLLPLPLLYLSAYFERHRDRYCDLLLAVSQRGAWRDWVLFFLQGVAEQSRDASARARRLQDLQAEWRAKVAMVRSSGLLSRLADHLFLSPVITIPQAQKVLGVTYHSAQGNVEKLVGAGILIAGPESPRGKLFVAQEILRILSEPGS